MVIAATECRDCPTEEARCPQRFWWRVAAIEGISNTHHEVASNLLIIPDPLLVTIPPDGVPDGVDLR